jgi:hydrogenase nickel incorporation protein HypA/HybF
VHELSIAQAVVAIATEHATGRRVTRVDLRVGVLRQVVPGALELAWQAATAGTVAEGAELAIERVPVRVACRACGEAELEDVPLACPACGRTDVAVVAGEELVVESMDVEEPVASGGSRARRPRH